MDNLNLFKKIKSGKYLEAFITGKISDDIVIKRVEVLIKFKSSIKKWITMIPLISDVSIDFQTKYFKKSFKLYKIRVIYKDGSKDSVDLEKEVFCSRAMNSKITVCLKI